MVLNLVVTYHETVSDTSNETCLSKTPDKHNHIYLQENKLCKEIEEGKLGPKAEPKERAKGQRERYDWSKDSAHEIWKHIMNTFQWIIKEGRLCEENMCGTRFNIQDVMLYADFIHRAVGQNIPPTRRYCFAAELTAKPMLQELISLIKITSPQDVMNGVYNCLDQRRGYVYEENPCNGTPLVQVKGHLPPCESFGLDGVLRQALQEHVKP
eukprot:16430590-Heterocapsa_arctica.AAC.1